MGLDAVEALLGFGGCSAPGGERLPEGRQQQVLLSRIDISPYMNPDPLTVQPGCSMARVYSLFRGVGLRHLCVVNDRLEPLGMITRKDLMSSFSQDLF